MDMNTAEGRCRAICWIVGAVVAIIAYVLFRPALAILLALIVALVLGVIVATVLMRLFCVGKAGSAPSEALSPDAVAPPASAPVPGAGAALTADPALGAQGGAPVATAATPPVPAPEPVREDTVAPAVDAMPVEDEPAEVPDAPAKMAKMPDISDPEVEDADAGTAADMAVPGEGSRPEGLTAPRDGQADDLKRIKGVGPKLEQLCNQMGFWHFDQIAAWGAEEVAWVDQNLVGFKGRVSRDDWVGQAKLLATGAETEFSKRVDKGDVY
ncbi:endonuclease [Pseudooceanicola pacificus]|uniref:endonuclease n=1 Tax=Pseudooceanicola pacificus TaxID=2676438 RepID=UPI001F3D2DBB|nr:endonuclease [Pseudooceanicola pacificus]